MAPASEFGPTTQKNNTAPAQAVQPGFVDPSGLLQAGQIDGSGNIRVAVTGAGSGGTSSVDGAAFVADTTAGTPAMGAYQSSPSVLTDGDLGVIALDANRNVKVNIVAGSSGNSAASATGAAVPTDADYQGFQDGASGNLTGVRATNLDYDTGGGTVGQTVMGIALPASGGPVAGGTATNPVRVDPTGTTTQPISAASLPLPSGAATAANQQTDALTDVELRATPVPVSAAALPLPSGASTAAKQPALGTAGTASADVITIQGIASMTKLLVTPDTNSAINLAQVGGTNVVTGGTNGTQAVGGIQAHDAADSGNNPVKVGAKATNAEPSAVSASGDIANLITDLVGKLIVLPYANPENFVSGAITSAMTGTTSTSLVAAPAAGLRNYLTTIIASNAHATVGTDIVIQDGSGGTTLLTIPAAAVYGGAVITLPTPLRQPTTATAIFCANVTTGASTKVSAVGYKGA